MVSQCAENGMYDRRASLRKHAVGERVVEVVLRGVPVGCCGYPGRALPITLARSPSHKGRHEVDAESGPDDQLVRSLIGEAQPRSEILIARVVQSAPDAADAIVNHRALYRRAQPRTDRIGSVEVEIVLIVEAFRGRGLVFPADTQIQRHPTSDLPVVLQVGAEVMLGGERPYGDASREIGRAS